MLCFCSFILSGVDLLHCSPLGPSHVLHPMGWWQFHCRSMYIDWEKSNKSYFLPPTFFGISTGSLFLYHSKIHNSYPIGCMNEYIYNNKYNKHQPNMGKYTNIDPMHGLITNINITSLQCVSRDLNTSPRRVLEYETCWFGRGVNFQVGNISERGWSSTQFVREGCMYTVYYYIGTSRTCFQNLEVLYPCSILGFIKKLGSQF